MTAFCVFGVTRAQCKKIADDKVPMRDENRRLYTQDERAALVEKMAAELFESGGRTKQISPAFDAPHFARDWIAIGLKAGEIRNPRIMKRGTKTDKHGNLKTNKKTGLAVISWIPYA